MTLSEFRQQVRAGTVLRADNGVMAPMTFTVTRVTTRAFFANVTMGQHRWRAQVQFGRSRDAESMGPKAIRLAATTYELTSDAVLSTRLPARGEMGR